MKYTPAQCRAAFYQAAAYIEANPDMYDFARVNVGNNCPACMWGHVGRALGLPANTFISKVTAAAGFETRDLYNYKTDEAGDFFISCAQSAVLRLRAFADFHWPAEATEPVRPDLAECGQSFGDLMADIKRMTMLAERIGQ